MPFSVAILTTDHDSARVAWLVAATLAVSFAHQPLTAAMVYADPVQRAQHRRLFTWSPLVLAAVVVIGLQLSVTLVALVAGVWNAAHTLRQRYGAARIYGRLVGQTDGSAEHRMLWSWLALAAVVAVAHHDIADALSTSFSGRWLPRPAALRSPVAC